MPQFTNPTATGTKAIGASPWTTEQILAEMDTGAGGIATNTIALLNIVFQWSLNAPTQSKGSIVRVREGGLTGTILASQSAGDQGDSTAGNQNTLTVSNLSFKSATGRVCLTIQDTNYNAPWYSAQRTMTVSDPVDVSSVTAAGTAYQTAGGAILYIPPTTFNQAGTWDYTVNGGAVQSTSTILTTLGTVAGGSTIQIRARNGSTTGAWTSITVPTNLTLAGEIISDLPLAYWKLDDASGTTVADTAGYGRTATREGSTTLGAASLVPESSSAMDVQGGTAYIASATWMQVAQSFTAECVINLSAYSANGGMVLTRVDAGQGYGPGYAWYINVNSTGKITWGSSATTPALASRSPAPPPSRSVLPTTWPWSTTATTSPATSTASRTPPRHSAACSSPRPAPSTCASAARSTTTATTG